MRSNKTKYISKYNKEKYRMYPFRIKKTDKAIIEKLDSVPSMNKYITDLILNDIGTDVLTIEQIKIRIKPVMENRKVKEAYLFGSYSRGEATRISDVDIYCDRGDIKSLGDQAEFVDELKEALGKDVDLVIIGSDMNEYFQEQLDKDKIKLF